MATPTPASIEPFVTHALTFHAPFEPPNPIPRGKLPHWNVYAVPHGAGTYSIEVCWVRWTAPVNWAELALPALNRGFEYIRTLYPDMKPMWGTISMRTAVRLYRERVREQPHRELGDVHRAGLRVVDQFWLQGVREWHPIEDQAILRYWESLIPRNGDGAEEEEEVRPRMKMWEERIGLQPGLNANIRWRWMPDYSSWDR
ncbi:uncharacterized protein BO66DRAFT_430046 [Aspergillus aculeatinus CBS 121060]|uniref:Uncharacterized protein n=1 Tax=Aspergillus aculeatinus CBS 121060 TaxID=1448322 RepID=A0ACD1H477_9EURO|nr:hypothetical protein BO66DRAFT_430046 [Aspergillus aculeatinus CBS 121060]RAH68407.1 hypothetical protein BO66DRAFT_430046 [Aspergillus aculeatinus CBS 121060]